MFPLIELKSGLLSPPSLTDERWEGVECRGMWEVIAMVKKFPLTTDDIVFPLLALHIIIKSTPAQHLLEHPIPEFQVDDRLQKNKKTPSF